MFLERLGTGRDGLKPILLSEVPSRGGRHSGGFKQIKSCGCMQNV